MMKLIVSVLIFTFPLMASASEEGYPLDHITPDIHDQASLQRGAKTYMNYCLGCHGLKYQRYNRTAKDLGIPEKLMLENLVFSNEARIGDLIHSNLSVKHAKDFFGAAPPDLTLHSHLKGGPDWTYTYLRTFYKDDSRPFGVNNLVFENVGMPHILAGMQGMQERPDCMQVPKKAANNGVERDFKTDKIITEEKCGDEVEKAGQYPLVMSAQTGTLTTEEYDQVVYDLVNFLYYVAEPARLDRTRIGTYVLLFLAFFYVFTWLLGREYHKEFHK